MSRRFCLWFPIFLAAWVPAEAQTGISAYAVAGPGWLASSFDTGDVMVFGAGGVELITGPGIGVGTELGTFADHSGATLSLLSLDGVVRLSRSRNRRIVPFLAAGWTGAYGPEDSFSGWNVGGGVHWWSGGRIGFRAEFRDHIRNHFGGVAHYPTIRAGIAVRQRPR